MAATREIEPLSAEALELPEFIARWERLKRHTPQASVFSSPGYIREFGKCTEYRPAPCVVHDSDGEFEAGLLGLERRVGPYTCLEVPPFVQFTPLLLRTPLQEHEVHAGSTPVHELLSHLRRRYASTGIHLLPEVQDARPAGWSGFQARPLYTYRIHLGDSTPPEDSWSSSAQRLLRKFGGDFRVDTGISFASEVISLCAHSYERHGRSLPLPAPALERLVHGLDELRMIRVFALRPTGPGPCEAGVIVLHEEDLAHYWIAGGRPGPGMTVLLGHVLRELQASGIGTFDFVGANTPSVAEFKRRFGPQLVSYYRIEHTRAIGLRLLNVVRNRLA